ncbi:MAG: hypothetical protein OEY87_06635 [Gammaproteobacteria bacterium]|nr:hypothetical protein [Gammaproteobacteria bacterium]MDH5735783.1 hypothetical protein [Gammaproteobacteria bacterium]
MKTHYIKIIITVIVFMCILLVQMGWLDEQGKNYTEQGLKRALVTYALARGLNGVISVAQGTEIAVQPVGVGLTFAPGQILDPVNDLIERFSTVVLVSGASLGIQRMLIEITSWFWFSLLCSFMLFASVFMIWKHALYKTSYSRLLYKTTAILLLIRLSVPLIAVLNEGVYLLFLQSQYEESSTQLETVSDNVNQLQQNSVQPQANQESFLEKMQALYDSAADAVDIQSQLASLKQIVSDMSQHALNLMVVFVLQTLILPIVFLFIAYKSILRLFRI